MIQNIFKYLGYFLALSGLAGVVSLNVASLNSKTEREQILISQKNITLILENTATKEDVKSIESTQLKLIDAVGKHIAKDSSSIKQDVVNFYTLFRKEFQIEFNKQVQKSDSQQYKPEVIIQKLR